MTHLFFQISKHLGKEKARETDLLGMTHATPPSLFSFLPLPDIWFQSLIPNGNPKAPHVRPVTFLPSPLLLSWSLHLRLQRNFSIYLHIPGLPRTSLKGGFWPSQMEVYTESKPILHMRREMTLHSHQLCVTKQRTSGSWNIYAISE